MSDDVDLEALFDEISSQTLPGMTAEPATAAAAPAAAERELAQLLRDNAPPEVKAQIDADKPATLMNGPSVGGTAMAQDDVDDLLDSLGF